jgi:hypothetical protein
LFHRLEEVVLATRLGPPSTGELFGVAGRLGGARPAQHG